jgi:hypothetical protein
LLANGGSEVSGCGVVKKKNIEGLDRVQLGLPSGGSYARASKKAGSKLGCLLKYSAAVEPTWRISDRQDQILVLPFWCESFKPLKLFPLCSAAAGTTSARSLIRHTSPTRCGNCDHQPQASRSPE